MKELDYTELAKKVMEGFKVGDINPKKIGIVGAELQKLYRRMKKDDFNGNASFYVCKVLYDRKFDDLKKMLSIEDVIVSIAGVDIPINLEMAKITKEEAFCMTVWSLTMLAEHSNDESTDSLNTTFNVLQKLTTFELTKNKLLP